MNVGMAVESVRVEISPGELIDKITILQIKAERMIDADKLANVKTELDSLSADRDAAIPSSAELDECAAALKKVNEALWYIEDEIRACERSRDFGPKFVELARSVYVNNDERAALKRRINQILGAKIVEVKSYQPYR